MSFSSGVMHSWHLKSQLRITPRNRRKGGTRVSKHRGAFPFYCSRENSRKLQARRTSFTKLTSYERSMGIDCLALSCARQTNGPSGKRWVHVAFLIATVDLIDWIVKDGCQRDPLISFWNCWTVLYSLFLGERNVRWFCRKLLNI